MSEPLVMLPAQLGSIRNALDITIDMTSFFVKLRTQRSAEQSIRYCNNYRENQSWFLTTTCTGEPRPGLNTASFAPPFQPHPTSNQEVAAPLLQLYPVTELQ